MLKIPRMLMIGGAGRNTGKTKLACAIIRRFGPRRRLIGLKVTTVRAGRLGCPRGRGGCGACAAFRGAYCLTRETYATSSKDTARLLAAGARSVFWLRVRRARLRQGWNAFIRAAGNQASIVCESNSLRTIVEPGVFLMLPNASGAQSKPSAAAVEKYADRLVPNDRQSLAAALADLRLDKAAWQLREKATAVILAGGASRRMGRDKSRLPLNGRPLWQTVHRQLQPLFAQVLISAGTGFKARGLGVVRDRVAGLGPLMGLATALEAAKHDRCFAVACDIPVIPAPVVRRMLALARAAEAVVLRVKAGGKQRVEPLFAVYRRSLAPRMRQRLAAGERRIRSIFRHCRVRYYDAGKAPWLKNLNTPREYRAYLASVLKPPRPRGVGESGCEKTALSRNPIHA
jgi:molybdenum cofactor guanylyltransferase